jgi:hypothetical protein
MGPVTRMRRTRFLRAMATARLASSCPTMYLSSSATISLGESSRVRSSTNGLISIMSAILHHWSFSMKICWFV